MPQNDLDELTGRTTDGVSRTARYLQIFDGIIDAARAGDHDGARSGWAALPRWESLSEAERREIEDPLIRKFEELSAAYAAAPSPPSEGWGAGPHADGEIGCDEEVRRTYAENARLHAALDAARDLWEARRAPAETQETISNWAEATFGPGGSNARAIARANREMAELLEHVTSDDRHPEAAEEIADVVIVLYRVATRLGVDLHQRIDAKMARNRVRKWRLDGTGHGYHVKEAAPTTIRAPARTLAASAEYGGGGSSIRRSGWLAKIEALAAGDACEVKDALTGSWVPAVVLRNGGSGLWQIRREDGQSHMPYIEQVRLPGQTEAWR